MNKRLILILLSFVLVCSIFTLVACGDCQHYFEGGICTNCGEMDANYNPANDQVPCQHWFENGACTLCGEVDANYNPNNVPGTDYNATSIRVATKYGKNGDSVAISGTVFATEQNGYYINDGTAAIFVVDNTVVAIGDVVYIQATLALEGAFNQPTANATLTEVVLSGQTVVPQDTTVIDFVKAPVLPTNFYKYVTVAGFVAENEGVYSLTLDGNVIYIDSSCENQFADIVGQKVTATVVSVGYTNNWVVKTVSDNAVAITPADLDVVADEIFNHVATLLPTDTFTSFEVPTKYVLEPTVEFSWSVSGVDGVELQGTNLVAILSVTEEVTVPLTLTLSCDGKTKTYTYNVSVNADYVFEWAQEQLPTSFPLVYTLPTSYNNENNITFEWSVEQGNAIAIASNVLTVDASLVTQDTVAKARLTIKAGNNEMSKVFDFNLPANGVSAFDDVASLPVGTTAKVVGTVLLKSYDHNKKDYSMAIVAENNDMYEVAFGTNTTEWAKYNAGDKVQITGQVREVWDSYTGKTIVRLTLSCDDVALVETAPSDYKIDISNMTVVTLATLEDYQNFVVNFDTKTGRTIVKIVNPYLVSSSGSGAGNYIRFGPDTTAASGYSNKVDGKTWKREFVFARNMLKEVCGTAFHDSLQVGATTKATPIQNTLEVYAVPMHLGDTTWQFVPISADFVTYTPAN